MKTPSSGPGDRRPPSSKRPRPDGRPGKRFPAAAGSAARPAENRPAGKRPEGKRLAETGPAGKRPPETRSIEKRSAGRRPEGKRVAETGPAGKRPPETRPAEKRPTGARPEDSGDSNAADLARRHATKSEQKVSGVRACAALFAHRPGDIIRVYLTANRKPTFKALLEHCVAHRLGFQVVEDESLQRLSAGIHHEGIVILAREPARGGADDLLAGIESKRISGPLLWLDGVQNPHNLGSILRSAAHFGCGGVVGERASLPPLSAAAMRVAEGGAECVPLFAIDDPVWCLGKIKKLGFRVVSTTSRCETLISAAGLSRDVVLVLGSEAAGVSSRIVALADMQVRIPGTGVVQSLNVAVACGIALAEACRGESSAGAGGKAAKAGGK